MECGYEVDVGQVDEEGGEVVGRDGGEEEEGWDGDDDEEGVGEHGECRIGQASTSLIIGRLGLFWDTRGMSVGVFFLARGCCREMSEDESRDESRVSRERR